MRFLMRAQRIFCVTANTGIEVGIQSTQHYRRRMNGSRSMNGRKIRFLALLLALAAIVFTAGAQPVDGALTAGLPSAGQVNVGQVLRFEYTVSTTSAAA